jgi:TolB-like protein/DNA-binding winged helix-turn-helix (wHTH) protein/Flp pilus assembly protein TadD
MEALSSTGIFLFEGFRLDRRGLFRRDENTALAPVEIGSRSLAVLRVLLERPGDLVSRDEIMDAAWPGTVVEDNNLTVQISTLRRVLDQDRAQGGCIQTVAGRGYRFVAPVTRVEPAAPVISELHSGGGRSGSVFGNGQSRDASALSQIDGMPRVPTSRVRHRLWGGAMAAVIGALVLVAGAAVGIWHAPWSGDAHPAPRLSIVVLPFANLGNVPDRQYFADGVTEDLTIDLSRLADMFVSSRNTAFTYRNKQVDTKQIGRELGVRYVLEGSVQRSSSQLRVSAELIDAETDAHLWAERFDGDTVDLFALQNEITTRIASALGVELIVREAARPNDHPDVLDYIFRGRAAIAKGPARENTAQAISLFERALALDPQSLEAKSRLAAALIFRVIIGASDSAAADIARSDGLVSQALAASPRDWYAHWVKGQVLRAQHRCADAIPEYETALAFNRNFVVALNGLGWCKLEVGSIEEVIPLEEKAIRLSPRDPAVGFWYGTIGFVYLLQSRIDEAISWLERARNALPGIPHLYLVAAYALKGETGRAAAELAEARRLSGDGRYSSIARAKIDGPLSGYWGVPKVRALVEATYFAGLRKAGVPED